MIKTRLVTALDFRRRKGDTKRTVTTRKAGDRWLIDECGPGYANCYEVAEFDAKGLAWLEARQSPEAPAGK